MPAEATSVLLSRVLVAFTIELDNEHEARMARTWARPFKTSLVMWSNGLRFVSADGTTVGDLAALTAQDERALASIVGGMERWGYLTVDHDPADGHPGERPNFGTAKGIRSSTVLRPSITGEVAAREWMPLLDEIEQRWRQRMGDPIVDGLRAALLAIADPALPPFLPVLSARGLFSAPVLDRDAAAGAGVDDLASLLSRTLLRWTLEHESGATVALPIAANVLRVLGDEPVAVKDLPGLTSVAKEAVSMSLSWLSSSELAAVEPGPGGKGKVVVHTERGRAAQEEHVARQAQVEQDWARRFGVANVEELRRRLLEILTLPAGPDGPLTAGLVPPADGWRTKSPYRSMTEARVTDPAALPHHPMVLHRGGWPDGC